VIIMILSLIILFGELYLSTIIALTPVTDLLYRIFYFLFPFLVKF
jgi:hypothetical protein